MIVQEKEGVEKLIESVQELAMLYGCTANGNPKTATVLKLLTSELCERKIESMLKHAERDTRRFDPLYKERSAFATRYILDYVKSKLEEKGHNVSITCEEKSFEGTYDAVIGLNGQGSVSPEKKLTVRIEIKASLGLELEQIQRYLLDPSPLILVRIIPCHVLLLTRELVEKFVKQSVDVMLAKIQRLENGRPFTVPGPQCYSCCESNCPYNRTRGITDDRIIIPSNEDFTEEMALFFRNLPIVSDKVASIVIDYLTPGRP